MVQAERLCFSHLFTSLRNLRAYVYNDIQEIAGEWDEFTANKNSLFTSSALKGWQDSGLENLSFYYVIIKEHQQTKAVFYFQLLDVQPEYYPDFSNYSFASEKLYKAVAARNWRLLLNGHFFINDFQSMLIEEQENIKPDKLVDYVVKLMRRKLKADIFIMKDCPEFMIRHFASSSDYFFTDYDRFMELEIEKEWKSINDYRDCLTKKYAGRVDKLVAEAAQWQKMFITANEYPTHKDEIEQLYQQVIERSPVKLGVLNKTYFGNMLKNFPHDFKLLIYYHENKAIAFASYFIINNEPEIYYIGIDYNSPAHKTIYPVMLIDGLSFAIEYNYPKLRLGRTALEAKAMLGAQPRILNNFIWFRNPVLKLAYKYLVESYWQQQGDGWKKRNPFRKSTVLH
jgi:hypothetical protein